MLVVMVGVRSPRKACKRPREELCDVADGCDVSGLQKHCIDQVFLSPVSGPSCESLATEVDQNLQDFALVLRWS